jgi:hypothetical protein
MVAQVEYSMAEQSGGRVTLYAICTVHVETRVRVSWLSLKTKVKGLSVVWPQNHWDGFLRYGLKTDGMCFPVWVSKLPRRFFGLGLKTKQAFICQLRHKIVKGRMA